MIVTLNELANDPKRVLDRVAHDGDIIKVEREGRTIAQIAPVIGISRGDFLQVLRKIRWTEPESRELKEAIDAASGVFG